MFKSTSAFLKDSGQNPNLLGFTKAATQASLTFMALSSFPCADLMSKTSTFKVHTHPNMEAGKPNKHLSADDFIAPRQPFNTPDGAEDKDTTQNIRVSITA